MALRWLYMSTSVIQTMVLTQITHIRSYPNIVGKPSRTTLIIHSLSTAKLGDNVLGSVHLSARLTVFMSVCPLLAELFGLWPCFLRWGSTLVKVIGQGQITKNCVLHHCLLALRSKVGVKVKGQSEGYGSSVKGQGTSIFKPTAVDIRGSALPSAEKSNSPH